MDDLTVFLIYMTAMFAVLSACGFGADYILPHIKPLELWIDSLPMMDDKECFHES